MYEQGNMFMQFRNTENELKKIERVITFHYLEVSIVNEQRQINKEQEGPTPHRGQFDC